MNRNSDGLSAAQRRFLKSAGLYIRDTQRRKQADFYTDDTRVGSNWVSDKALGIALTLGALGLTIPAYKFIQSARKSYKNRVEGLSDITRSSQAWEALRRNRDYDYLAPRAILEHDSDK